MAKNDWKETMLTGIGSTGNDTSAVERDFRHFRSYDTTCGSLIV